MLTAGIWLFWLWDHLGVEDCWEGMDPPDQIRRKHLCQQAGRLGEENFSLWRDRRELVTSRQERKW